MNVIVCLGFVLGALSAAATVIHTKPGQRVTLECGVDSYSTSLTWKHKDELILNIDAKTGFPRKGSAAIKQRSSLKLDKNLLISGVKKEDAGAFTCEADRISHVHTLLVVSVSARPSQELQVGGEVTLQCEVAGLTSDSTVKWAGPDGRVPEGSDTVRLNPVAASDNGAWECVFSYGGQEYREKLDLRVKGPVSPTPPPVRGSDVNNGTPCPNCHADTGGWGGPLGWWLWAAAGAGCVVVLLLTVLVIVLCRRIRRRKRKLQKMRKNGRGSAKTYCQCNCRAAAEKPQRGRPKARPATLALKPQLMA